VPLLLPLSNLSLLVDLEVSTTEPYFRQGSDIAQVYLPVVRAIAGAIPIAGAPVQAAIGGLLAILQIIDVGVSLTGGSFLSMGTTDKRSE
jgi:hypothetical protein